MIKQQMHQQTSTNKQAQVIAYTEPINHISNHVHIDYHVDIVNSCREIVQSITLQHGRW